MISCWMRIVDCVSPGRTPQPLSIAGSMIFVAFALPKLMLLPASAPHVSMVPVAGLWPAGFDRLQSTTLLLLLSVQGRAVTLDWIVTAGLLDVYGASFAPYARYRP